MTIREPYNDLILLKKQLQETPQQQAKQLKETQQQQKSLEIRNLLTSFNLILFYFYFIDDNV